MNEGQGITGKSGHEPPRAARTNLFIAAVLEIGSASLPVTARNLSESGALIEGQALPPAGSAIRLVRGSLAAAGSMAWVHDRRGGLKLTDPIPIALWMAKPGNVGQADIDAAVRRIKAGQAVAAPAVSPAAVPSLADSLRELEQLLAAVSRSYSLGLL